LYLSQAAQRTKYHPHWPAKDLTGTYKTEEETKPENKLDSDRGVGQKHLEKYSLKLNPAYIAGKKASLVRCKHNGAQLLK